MEKRDLKADLELCKQLESDWEKVGNRPWLTEELYVDFAHVAREGWPHAIERAMKAEALARELAKKMELMHMAVNALLLGEDVPVEVVDRITLGVSSVLLKAKEVLGDG